MVKLVACKACKKEVAQYARTCPHCGQKNPTINTAKGCLGIIIFALLAAVLLTFIGGESKEASQKLTHQKQKTTETQNKSLVFGSFLVGGDTKIAGKEATAIYLVDANDENSFLTITIAKENIKNGFSFINDQQNYSPVGERTVDIKLTWNKRLYRLLPSPDNGSLVKLRVIDHDINKKKTTFLVSALLVDTNNRKSVLNLNKFHVSITNDSLTINGHPLEAQRGGKYFDSLTSLNTQTPPTHESSSEAIDSTRKINHEKDILLLFEAIIKEAKAKRDNIQHVRLTQPLGRGERGSIYIAKWNGDIQRWERTLEKEHKEILGKGRTDAPFCPDGAFNTRMVVSSLKLLGIAYVFGEDPIGEKNLAESIATAEKEITACKDFFVK